jgi:hypothetical protein
MKILTQDDDPEQEIYWEPYYPYAKKPIPPHPDRQACHVGSKPDQENAKEQSPVVHKIISMYNAPSMGFAQ